MTVDSVELGVTWSDLEEIVHDMTAAAQLLSGLACMAGDSAIKPEPLEMVAANLERLADRTRQDMAEVAQAH